MGSKQKQEYARLLVKCGLNVQPGQNVVIDVDVENQAFAKMVVQEAYAAGAKHAIIRYTDIRADQLRIVNQSATDIKKVEHWERESVDTYLRENGCHLLLTSSYVGLLDEIGEDKAASYQQRTNELRNVVRHRMTTHKIQWCIAPVPNRLWAKALFPHLDEKEAIKAFWKTIYGLVYMDKDEDAVTTWLRHQERLCQVRNKLNGLRLRELHFKTGLGTDLTIGLSQHVRWSGGVDIEGKKSFSANIPTEEVFTSPDKYKVEGKVVASRPLYIAGSVIEEFSLTFKQGKVVEITAKKNKKLLENLINTDEGSCYLGEVALVEASSAISRSGLLFYNTLLDENASCHLALGKGFAGAIDGARSMPDESWEALHLNVSSIHVDFMFGTEDLEIEAYNEDGLRIRLFENGDFAI